MEKTDWVCSNYGPTPSSQCYGVPLAVFRSIVPRVVGGRACISNRPPWFCLTNWIWLSPGLYLYAVLALVLVFILLLPIADGYVLLDSTVPVVLPDLNWFVIFNWEFLLVPGAAVLIFCLCLCWSAASGVVAYVGYPWVMDETSFDEERTAFRLEPPLLIMTFI